MIEALAARKRATVAVDVPSGVDGATGEVRGAAAARRAHRDLLPQEARSSVAARPRALRRDGVADIGIPAAVLERDRAAQAWRTSRRCGSTPIHGRSSTATNTAAAMRWSRAAR